MLKVPKIFLSGPGAVHVIKEVTDVIIRILSFTTYLDYLYDEQTDLRVR